MGKRKRTKIQKLEDGLAEVKELVKEYKQKNGNTSCRILNKDILFWLLTKQVDDDRRIARLEGMLKIIIPIMLGLIGLNTMNMI